jgi:hypothetical protein
MAEYILMRLAGRIVLRRKILRTCKRLEPSRLWIEYVRPNFRLFWIVRPNACGIELFLVRVLRLVRVGIRRTFWGNILEFYWVKLRIIQLLEHYYSMRLRVGWVSDDIFPVRCSDTVLSSTNIHIFVSGELIFKSLIMTRNKIGPSFVLWVTPAVTGSQLQSV